MKKVYEKPSAKLVKFQVEERLLKCAKTHDCKKQKDDRGYNNNNKS